MNRLISSILFIATLFFIACDKNPHSSRGSHTSILSLEDNKENRLIFKKVALLNELDYLKVEQKSIAQDVMRKADKYGSVTAEEATASNKTPIKQKTQGYDLLDDADGFATNDTESDNIEAAKDYDIDQESLPEHDNYSKSKISIASEEMSEANYDLNLINHKINKTTLDLQLVDAQLNIIIDKKILDANKLTDSETIRQLLGRIHENKEFIKEQGTDEDLEGL